MRALYLVLLAGCLVPAGDFPAGDFPAEDSGEVSGPTPVIAPGRDVFDAVNGAATGASIDSATEATLTIDLATCTYQRLHAYLGLGSAWFLVHPRDVSTCEMWLGGETENPMYDGSPAQYCVFDRAHAVTITLGDTGPILFTDMPWCVTL